MGQCVVDAKERSDPDNPFGDEAARLERFLIKSVCLEL